MKQIVLTLGAPNDEQGNLSPMAVDRLECTLGLYLHNDDVKILCTGGFGEFIQHDQSSSCLLFKTFFDRARSKGK